MILRLNKRPRIGLHYAFASNSGPGRYVKAILSALDPAEFDLVVFGLEGNEYGDPSTSKMVPFGEAVGRGDSAAGAMSAVPSKACPREEGGCRRLARAAYRRWTPFPAMFTVGTGRDAVRMARVLRHHHLDLFHAQHAGVIEGASFAARLAGVPKVLGTFHVDTTFDLNRSRSKGVFRLLQWVGNHSAHRSIAVSESTKRDWSRRAWIAERYITTIHNGVDPVTFCRARSRPEARASLGLPADNRIMVGAAGRLHAQKGFEYLVEAIAILAHEFPSLALVLAGDGDLRGKIESLAAVLGIGNRVFFPGFCSDVRVVYDALDIFAMPSLCEALPYALLEAMAHELPAVATSVGGVPEVVLPGVTGYLAPARDAAALAAGIRPLIKSAELRRMMGAAGRQRVIEYFHEDDCVRKTIDVYRQLLGSC